MARDLTATQQTLLSSNPFRTERLIELQTPAGSYYYTTGHHDVAASTATSSGTQTYQANNGIELLSEIREYYTLSINEISLTIGDVNNAIFENIARTQNDYDYSNSEVNVYWLFRNPTTGSAYTSSIFTLFQGSISRLDVTRDNMGSKIQLSASNKFSNFDLVKNRKISDFANGITAQQINWGSVRSI